MYFLRPNTIIQLFRWDSLGVLGLVCRLYSEREDNDKDDYVMEKIDLEKNKEDGDKTVDKNSMTQDKKSKGTEKLGKSKNEIIEKTNHGVKEEICVSSDSSDIENDENEDEITLFTFENDFIWDE